MEIRVWRFQNYRDCGYTWNPHKFEIPALWFSRRVPVNPCKHLQCSHSIQVSFFQNVVHPVGLFNPVGFVNPVGLVNVNNCKLSRSTNLALNFPKILNLYNIFQTPSHTCLQVLFCLHWIFSEFPITAICLNLFYNFYLSFFNRLTRAQD